MRWSFLQRLRGGAGNGQRHNYQTVRMETEGAEDVIDLPLKGEDDGGLDGGDQGKGPGPFGIRSIHD